MADTTPADANPAAAAIPNTDVPNTDVPNTAMPNAEDFLTRFEASQAALIALERQIAAAPNWQEKYRALMLGGKTLSALPDIWQQDPARVRGCESAAWLYHHAMQDAAGTTRHYFIANSEARIVSGLIALLLSKLNGENGENIAAFDAPGYFQSLGLAGQLSPSRTNGLYALCLAMKSAAAIQSATAMQSPAAR